MHASGGDHATSRCELASQTARATAPVNAIGKCLDQGRFFWTFEFIPSADKALFDELDKLCPFAGIVRDNPELAGFSVTDRVHSDHDPDPPGAALHLLNKTGKQPLVHFSGKGRNLEDLYATLRRIQDGGLENVLIVTGDRLKSEPRDRRPRYLESVPAIHAAREIQPHLRIAAALNPFKYREEDAMAQYLKLAKKVDAGADFVMTQIGLDMRKYEEAMFCVNARNYRVPLVANVIPMSAARARYIRRQRVPGIIVTDSVMQLLEEEERTLLDKGASRVIRRLALQIIGIRLNGYAGVQVTGLHQPDKLLALQRLIAELHPLCTDRVAWSRAWDESLISPSGIQANPVPHEPWYLAHARIRRASLAERFRYRVMERIHDFAFDRGVVATVLAPLFRRIDSRHGRINRMLAGLERAIKGPLFGCETCGMCRLAQTQFVCPETCPKGLANGACGGTDNNLCEFGDRECVHSVKYRIAKDAGALRQLETELIPAVPEQFRQTCSWPAYFKERGMRAWLIRPVSGQNEG